MKAHFTHGDAYDSIVITREDGTIRTVFTSVDPHLLRDFTADDPGAFRDWDGDVTSYDLEEGEYTHLTSVEDFGEVVATREDGHPVIVVDARRWEERVEFYT